MKNILQTTLDSLVEFINKNPMWILGFVDGEGCFTASITVDPRSTWGFQPQAEFNITQSTSDIIVLQAINVYFRNIGSIFNRPNNVSVLVFRNLKIIVKVIIPFFQQYPLLTLKGLEFNSWQQIVNLLVSKRHVGATIEARDGMVELATIIKNMNSNRFGAKKKAQKYDIIIEWLSNLSEVPTIEAKLELKILLESFK